MTTLTGRVVAALLCTAGCTASVAACSIDETHYESVVLPARPKRDTVTCNSPFVTPNLTQLKACGGDGRGKGHCFDAAKVPYLKEELSPCEGSEVCVPDKLLAAGGKKLKSCTFFLDGRPGACISQLTKGVFASKDLLKQDSCDEDERCLPCIDPRNGKDTSLCADTGVHQLDCIGLAGEKPVACCHKMGECISPDALPKEARASMIPDTCKAGLVCAPTSQLDAKPVRCEFLGGRGVCLDVCFAAQLEGITAATRGGCGPTELCMPCLLTNTLGGEERLIGCE